MILFLEKIFLLVQKSCFSHSLSLSLALSFSFNLFFFFFCYIVVMLSCFFFRLISSSSSSSSKSIAFIFSTMIHAVCGMFEKEKKMFFFLQTCIHLEEGGTQQSIVEWKLNPVEETEKNFFFCFLCLFQITKCLCVCVINWVIVTYNESR